MLAISPTELDFKSIAEVDLEGQDWAKTLMEV